MWDGGIIGLAGCFGRQWLVYWQAQATWGRSQIWLSGTEANQTRIWLGDQIHWTWCGANSYEGHWGPCNKICWLDTVDNESSSCHQPLLSPWLPPLFNNHSLPPSALHQNCIVNFYFQLSPIIMDSHELAFQCFSQLRAWRWMEERRSYSFNFWTSYVLWQQRDGWCISANASWMVHDDR